MEVKSFDELADDLEKIHRQEGACRVAYKLDPDLRRMRAGRSFVRGSAADVASYDWLVQQAQAEQGHQLFNNYCAECHGPDLSGALGPALKGSAFLNKWTGNPLSALYHFEHTTMPALAPDSLPDADFVAITAYILEENGYAAGSEPLNRVKIGRTLPKP